jgi:hypothetical protein
MALSDEALLEAVSQRYQSRDKIQLLIDTLKNVSFCLDSIESDDINSKHPSCREFIVNTLAKFEGGK